LRLITTQLFAEIWDVTSSALSPELHMTKRAAKFASAIAASMLAGAPFATPSQSAPSTAADCLSGPKQPTPQGSHWYYRIDHTAKRQCWYLRAEREKPSQAAAQDPAPSISPAASPEKGVPRSVANAHAELPAPLPIEQSVQSDAAASKTSAISPAVSSDTDGQSSVVASRWPDQPAPEAAPQRISRKNDPGLRVSSSQNQPTTALTVGKFATAEAPSDDGIHSAKMMLVALLGATGIAALAGYVTLKRRKVRISRQAWQRKQRQHQTRFARNIRPVTGRDRATEFFSHLSRRTPA
jgi:hypothetical protein